MDKVLPVPSWLYAKLERWHHLSFLRAKDTMDMLSDILGHVLEREKISALIQLIKQDLGYQLHRAVQKVKCDLSENDTATFRFTDGSVDLEAAVKRSSFEKWIAEELNQIETCVDTLLNSAGVQPKDVDMIFLTGGSSFVPAVRRIFESRFGKDRIRSGNEFTSVARGLALRALQQAVPHFR
jgi:hypothetical chaperone protein